MNSGSLMLSRGSGGGSGSGWGSESSARWLLGLNFCWPANFQGFCCWDFYCKFIYPPHLVLLSLFLVSYFLRQTFHNNRMTTQWRLILPPRAWFFLLMYVGLLEKLLTIVEIFFQITLQERESSIKLFVFALNCAIISSKLSFLSCSSGWLGTEDIMICS